jgi:hypothetical protein
MMQLNYSDDMSTFINTLKQARFDDNTNDVLTFINEFKQVCINNTDDISTFIGELKHICRANQTISPSAPKSTHALYATSTNISTFSHGNFDPKIFNTNKLTYCSFPFNTTTRGLWNIVVLILVFIPVVIIIIVL